MKFKKETYLECIRFNKKKCIKYSIVKTRIEHVCSMSIYEPHIINRNEYALKIDKLTKDKKRGFIFISV